MSRLKKLTVFLLFDPSGYILLPPKGKSTGVVQTSYSAGENIGGSESTRSFAVLRKLRFKFKQSSNGIFRSYHVSVAFASSEDKVLPRLRRRQVNDISSPTEVKCIAVKPLACSVSKGKYSWLQYVTYLGILWYTVCQCCFAPYFFSQLNILSNVRSPEIEAAKFKTYECRTRTHNSPLTFVFWTLTSRSAGFGIIHCCSRDMTSPWAFLVAMNCEVYLLCLPGLGPWAQKRRLILQFVPKHGEVVLGHPRYV